MVKAVGIAAAVFLVGALPGTALAAPQGAAAGGQTVTYPAGQFDNGKARHFDYRTPEGVKVRYFILKSSDGVIRAAFDACDVCWREDKGYEQKGDVMVCRNCGRRFLSTRINEVSGGCNPVPLARKVEGGKVVIAVADILQGRRYFGGKP
jgi:uncharacterized membrane protein